MKGIIKKKRFLFAVLLLLISVFSWRVVYATETTEDDGTCPGVTVDTTKTYCAKTEVKPSSSEVKSRYGLKMKSKSKKSDDYEVSMTDGCKEKVTFKITSINGSTTAPGVGNTFTCNSSTTITAQANMNNDFGLPGVEITAQTTTSIQKAANDSKSCWWKCAEVTLYTTKKGSATASTPQIVVPTIDTSVITGGLIDCDNKTYAPDSFEGKFCYAKSQVPESQRRNFGSGYYTGDATVFKCNHKVAEVPSHPENLEGDDYFVNKSYLFGETHMTETATIVHHYYPHVFDDEGKLIKLAKEQIKCEIVCEEAVEVEYGPPVAAQAGVCFEYKVRATSRTACKMETAPDGSRLCINDVCNPYPQCVHGGGVIYTQAGPNGEFDACIKSCDGGKYTKKCNDKCYKAVYGNATAGAKVSNMQDILASKVANFPGVNGGTDFVCDGYFDYVGTGDEAIKWFGGQKGYAPGRWYCDGGWKNNSMDYRKTFWSDKEGFFRKDFGGTLCGAACYWDDCGANQYLNQYLPCDKIPSLSAEDKQKYCVNGLINILQYDCDKNSAEYERLVNVCNSKSSCSEEQATFTISVNYNSPSKTDNEPLGFPYKNQKDYIQYSPSAITSTLNQPNTTLMPDYPSEGNGIWGCYNNGAPSNLYRATWGFPSSWQNIKTGEYSYNYNGKTSGESSTSTIWTEIPHHFCLPGDAKPANPLWYNAMINKTAVEGGVFPTTTVYEYDAGLCHYSTSTYSVYNSAVANYVQNENDITYNIFAKTRKFGYLRWDIDIQCFYGYNDDPFCETYENGLCHTSKTTTDQNCIPDDKFTDVRVHTVDLTDLFPNENGAELTDPSQAGRTFVGYNWSEYAYNDKNPDYKSNPKAYMTKLQTSGDSIYTDANLDYEFYLSPKTIRSMRQESTGSSVNYTAFRDGDFKVDETTGVSRYTSSKIHSGVIPSADMKVPPVGSRAISCNNMVSWNNFTTCDPVHEQGRG